MTNYTYDEITGYAKSLVKPFGADKSLDILTTLSDASAALSLNESDNAVLIAGLSRMKLTDKTTQEYLNYSPSGASTYEALSKGDAAAVAEKVTRGEIRGRGRGGDPRLHAGAVRRPVGADGGHL